MDFSFNLLPIALFLGGLALFYNLWSQRSSRDGKKVELPPEPSGGLPFIGHLHLFGGGKPLCQTWATMADRYGSIFTIRLGVHSTVIISSHEAAKECFTTNDKILASRPKSNAGIYLGYNYAAFGFASYGAYWREMRKLAMLELLSSRRLETLKHIQVSEINEFVKDLYLLRQKKHIMVDISQRFELLTLNMIIRMIAGKRYFSGSENGDDGEAQRVGKIVKEFMYISGVLVPSDVIPFLKYFDFQGQVKSMKRVARELDLLCGSWIEEHKLKRLNSDEGISKDNQDFIDLMLSAIDDDHMFGFSRETIIKATMMSLMLAGSDTTSITLTWILSNLMNNKKALKLVQEELDQKVGRDRKVQDSDIPNLVYLQAVIKETLRLYPPAPVSVPHEAMEDIRVCGYLIPKGTRIFTNLWKLHRDPRVWSDPDEFLPERFLSSSANLDLQGQNFEFIPFGSGRRSCPGMTLALQVTHLTIASLLQGFNLATPNDDPVDMTEGLGITMPKAAPLEVNLTPRLPADLY
ncbi:hypothetical protein SLA2020_454770 [Shorea laevis]